MTEQVKNTIAKITEEMNQIGGTILSQKEQIPNACIKHVYQMIVDAPKDDKIMTISLNILSDGKVINHLINTRSKAS